MHETAYGNSLKKIQHANEKLIELREKITKYDAELKMSAAEAEIAKLSETFDVNLTTDFGEIESVIQQRIDQNRGKVRVAADLSSKGIAEIQAEERMQASMAEDALSQFEVELGLKSPETSPVSQAAKDLGPATTEKADRQADQLGAVISWRTDSPDPRSMSRSLLVVLGLVGLALWRYGAIGPKKPTGSSPPTSWRR
jgi:hypothetical protein